MQMEKDVTTELKVYGGRYSASIAGKLFKIQLMKTCTENVNLRQLLTE